MLDICVMLRSNFVKLHTIVWNTCGYTCKVIFYLVKVYTRYLKIFKGIIFF